MTRKKTVALCLAFLLLALAIIALPLLLRPDKEFSGADDAGSQMVSEIIGQEYTPWATPLIERILGRELPGETESLLFCLQTALGTAVLSFGFGYLVARKKYRTANDTPPNPAQSTDE